MSIQLDKYQSKVVAEPLTDNKCITVRAGAGSGKSTTMVAKAQTMIGDGSNPSSIVITTFSAKSALDLKHKYKKMFPNQLKIPHISTLHSLGITILKDFLGVEYQLMSEAQSVGLMKRCIQDLGFIDDGWFDEKDLFPFAKTVLDYISMYKEQNLGYIDILDDIEFNIFKYADKSSNYFNRKEFKEIAKYYDELKQEKGLYDFVDLIYEAYYQLKEDEDVLALVKDMYGKLIVDEAQDVNQLQWDFMMLIFAHRQMVVVGDPMQNIYNFRYSVPDNFSVDYLSKFFDEVVPLDLAYNYRSTKEIVKVGNILRKIGGDTLELEAFNGSKPASVQFTEVYDNVQEGTKVAELIKDLIELGYEYKDIAVVVRTNSVIRDVVQPALIKDNIPYKMNNYTAGTKLMDRVSSDVYFNALSVIYDTEDWFAFVDLMRLLLADEPFVNSLAEQLSKTKDIDSLKFTDSYEKKLYDRAVNIYYELVEMNETLDGYDKAGDMLANLFFLLKTEAEGKVDIVKDLAVVYKTILNFWYALKEEFKKLSVQKTLEAMILRARDYDKDVETDSVKIGSIHSFKGLEHKVSIVCGFTSFRPKKDIHNDLTNMVYVQLSRAIDKLIIVNSFNYVSDKFKVTSGYTLDDIASLKVRYKA